MIMPQAFGSKRRKVGGSELETIEVGFKIYCCKEVITEPVWVSILL